MNLSKSLRVALSLAVLVVGAGSAWAQTQPTGTWAAETTADYFYYGGSCTDGTYQYVVGGYQGVGSTTPELYGRFRRYDPANNQWTNMPQIASGTATGSTVWGYQYATAVAYHSYNGTNRIFIFGGYTLTGAIGSTTYSAAITNQIRMFTFSSPTTGTWTTISPTISASVYFNCAATMGDRIYIGGGATTNVLNIFDPTTMTMASGTALPAAQYYHGMAALPALGKIYSMGGYTPAGYTGINYEYTPQDNDASTSDVGGTWATRAPISNGTTTQPLYIGVKLFAFTSRIYAMGYNSSTGTQNQTFEYNAITNTWAQRATMTYGHYYYAAADVINGKGYIYGGQPNYFYGEEYTPPNFGSAPFEPTNITQIGSRAETSLQALPDQNQFDGWTNSQITFSANVTDPDANQQVRFRVQVKPQAAAWTSTAAVTNLDTGLTTQGTMALSYTIPAGGGYDWRWRIEDSFANSYPLPVNAWVEAFGTLAAPNTTSPDFRSDQIAPADPVAQSPSNIDIQVPDPVLGDVVLNWIESTDNGPVGGISYELQVARDGGFNDIEAQLFSTAGTSAYPITLTVSRDDKHWRIRARDVGGNFSAWSPPLHFRVTHNDGVDHSAGDAKKACGMTAFGGPAIGSALLGLAILGLAAGRRLFRK